MPKTARIPGWRQDRGPAAVNTPGANGGGLPDQRFGTGKRAEKKKEERAVSGPEGKSVGR